MPSRRSGCRASRSRRSCAPSTPRRRSAPASTRSGRARASTRCRSARGCRSGSRSTPIADALMPVVYCFARPTHTYLDFNAREDFEREIVVKVNVPELVRAELGRPSWGGDHVALGTNTDPYQWVEGRYRLMEGIWEAMRDHANPCSVLTKSPLLLRDVELFRQLRRGDRVLDRALDPDDRRAGVARDRAPHAAPAQAPRGGRRADAQRDPVQRPRRAADPRRQRRPAPGRGDPRDRGRGRRRERRPGSACTCAARSATSSSTGCASTGPTSSRATRSSTGAAPTCRARRGSASAR